MVNMFYKGSHENKATVLSFAQFKRLSLNIKTPEQTTLFQLIWIILIQYVSQKKKNDSIYDSRMKTHTHTYSPLHTIYSSIFMMGDAIWWLVRLAGAFYVFKDDYNQFCFHGNAPV